MSNAQDTEQDNKLEDYAAMREILMDAFNKGHALTTMDYPSDARYSGRAHVAQSNAIQGMAQVAEALLKLDEKMEPQQGNKPRQVQKRAANAS